MSTLEKAINLLQNMPERKLEAVYTYIQFVNTLKEDEETPTNKKSASSIAGIARHYTNPEPAPLEKEETYV